MTGTDGMAVSSYAFDDFGRNIDPFTGKRRDRNQKHTYTTNGNIIQPFAFTGYQEDEVSGLKFAQARYYKAETGRFQSEDNVKGTLNEPFTLNHYGYCWNNSTNLIDRNGNWPEWMQKAGEWCTDNKENLIKIGIGAACVVGGAVLVAATGGAALPVLLEGAVAMAEAGAIGAVIDGGIKTIDLAINGNLDSAHVGEIAQAGWDGFANGAMFGGIFHGFGTALKVGKDVLKARSALKNTGEIAENAKITSKAKCSLDGEESGDYVYRALNQKDYDRYTNGLGLEAKNPNGNWTLKEHLVNGSGKASWQNDPYISTTSDFSVAEGFNQAGSGHGIVKIDINKVPSPQFKGYEIYPRTNGVEGLPYHYSFWQQEISVYKNIPAEAIVDFFK